jgi:hypothetical protein
MGEQSGSRRAGERKAAKEGEGAVFAYMLLGIWASLSTDSFISWPPSGDHRVLTRGGGIGKRDGLRG